MVKPLLSMGFESWEFRENMYREFWTFRKGHDPVKSLSEKSWPRIKGSFLVKPPWSILVFLIKLTKLVLIIVPTIVLYTKCTRLDINGSASLRCYQNIWFDEIVKLWLIIYLLQMYLFACLFVWSVVFWLIYKFLWPAKSVDNESKTYFGENEKSKRPRQQHRKCTLFAKTRNMEIRKPKAKFGQNDQASLNGKCTADWRAKSFFRTYLCS